MSDLVEKIPKEWTVLPLEDVAEKIIDYRGKTPKKLGGDWSINGKYRALSAKSVKTGGLVNEDQINRVDEDLYQKWMKDEVQRDDILLTSEAPMGEVLIWESDEKIVLSQRLFAVRAKKEVSSKYLYYYFISRYFQSELAGRQSGSTVSGIRQTELVRTNVILPSRPEQDAITDVLSVLDDKINLLKEQNKTLEDVAQLLFKQWFIDFEFPNEEGQPYKSSGGKMVDGKLGEMPEGWSISKLGELAVFSNGRTSPERQDDGTYDVYGSNGVIGKTAHKNSEKNTIVIGRVGSYCGSLYFASKDCWVTDNAIKAISKSKSPNFLWYLLNTLKLSSRAGGSGQPLINQETLNGIDVIVPNNLVLESFEMSVKKIGEKKHGNVDQIKTLSEIRDTILPKLMSGEIRVSE